MDLGHDDDFSSALDFVWFATVHYNLLLIIIEEGFFAQLVLDFQFTVSITVV